MRRLRGHRAKCGDGRLSITGLRALSVFPPAGDPGAEPVGRLAQPGPGKSEGMGSQVAQFVKDGRIQEVADYRATDVVNTYWVWLRYELFRAALTPEAFRTSEDDLAAFLRARAANRPHLASSLP
jgi:hypothetical protein